jgi:hypothetical protein
MQLRRVLLPGRREEGCVPDKACYCDDPPCKFLAMNPVHGVHHLVQLPNQLMEKHVPFQNGSYVNMQQEPVLQAMWSYQILSCTCELGTFVCSQFCSSGGDGSEVDDLIIAGSSSLLMYRSPFRKSLLRNRQVLRLANRLLLVTVIPSRMIRIMDIVARLTKRRTRRNEH